MERSNNAAYEVERDERMKIDISQYDFGALCICALRYCMGRQTYMPGLVQEILKRNFQYLNDTDLDVLLDDKRFQARMHLYGSETDKVSWEKFWMELDEFVERRENERRKSETNR